MGFKLLLFTFILISIRAQVSDNGPSQNMSDAQGASMELDIHIENSDGSPPRPEDIAYVQQIFQRFQVFSLEGADAFLEASGFNFTETPFTFTFYGPGLSVDPMQFEQETSILQRYLPYLTIVYYEVWACINKRQSLMGLTVCDQLTVPEFTEVEAVLTMSYAGLKSGRGVGSAGMDEVLKVVNSLGYIDDPENTDTSTPAGLGNVIGQAFLDYQAQDGWNWDGKMTRSVNPMPYEDYTGYAPMNTPEKLVYPLRWQPLKETDNQGFFYFQQHVTPQAGRGKPIAMTKDYLESRTVDWPYVGSMHSKELTQKDEDAIRGYAEELFSIQRNLTDTQKMLVWYFDNKVRSLAGLPLAIETAEPIKNGTHQILLEAGMNMALYDSTILVWKEKLRHDAVRPPSIIQHIFKDETIQAWGGYGMGAAEIKGSEFSPYIRTMPHSEFPSASACVCQAVVDFFRVASGGKDELREPFVALFPQGSSVYEPGIVPAKTTVVLFHSLSEISRVCGESRLWGGLHFRPAVEAGQELCDGLGQYVYDYLVEKSQTEI
eukprot:TRINITY_DN1010_c0_g1_i4.p1 TRINITY_DN1010_c0_g1~~TRINITY_DN1010_c0_g1_i4.p1  ORF type:complete len:546 (-),score=59.07 TRINITY_DN1010_c0_g1_i4:192-1829(-)